MGRPPITLTPAQCREVETLAALLSQEQIADYFGIARNTFRAICARDEEVVAHYKRGKAKAIAHVANGLLQKARAGDTASSIFYLKTQAGWRETAAIEHSGPEGGPIELSNASRRLKDHLDRIAERIRAVEADDASVAGGPTETGGGRVKLWQVTTGTGGGSQTFTRPQFKPGVERADTGKGEPSWHREDQRRSRPNSSC